MKKHMLIPAFVLAATLMFWGFMNPAPSVKVKYPKKVNNIIQDKCYGCHSPESKGEKSRKKLNWDKLGALEQGKQLETFQAMMKVLDKGAMPPKKLLERYPDKKLTEAETNIMKKWAAKMERKASK